MDWNEQICFVEPIPGFSVGITSYGMSKAKQRLTHRFSKQIQTVSKERKRKYAVTTAHFFDSDFQLFIAVIIERIL